VLGAVVAPPDAVAATAVLRQLRPPHRILTILEGESLLNDASALLIYRLVVGTVAANAFSNAAIARTFLLIQEIGHQKEKSNCSFAKRRKVSVFLIPRRFRASRKEVFPSAVLSITARAKRELTRYFCAV
jgi:Sodium/hydrogen exchanger family